MQQQRARMEARRERLKKERKYSSGNKPAVTRDTSKDVSKQVLKYGSGAKKGVTRDTSKDTVKKPAPKPANTKPPVKKPVPKPVKPSAQANKGTGRDGTFGTGTYGKGRPSDKASTKKEQPKPKVSRRRGSGVKRTGKQGVNVGQALRNFVTSVDKNLKLTHKKGDTKKVGNSTFRWDGKRWVKLNRPF